MADLDSTIRRAAERLNLRIEQQPGSISREDWLAAYPPFRKAVEALDAVPRILYGLALDERQAMVAQQAIDRCRAALDGLVKDEK